MKRGHKKLVIVITGGAQGLGRFLAHEFFKQGHIVNAVDIQDIKDEKGINYYRGDVTIERDIKRIFSDIFNKYERVDVLINNAGRKYFSLLKDMSLEDVAKTVEVNLKAIYLATKEILTYMKRNSFGRIINISSSAGLSGYKGSSIYSATKAGVNLFTESISQEMGDNITVNSICPGTVELEGFKTDDIKCTTLIKPQRIFKVICRLINSRVNGRVIPILTKRAFLSYVLLETKRLIRIFI